MTLTSFLDTRGRVSRTLVRDGVLMAVQTHGPCTIAHIQSLVPVHVSTVACILRELVRERRVIREQSGKQVHWTTHGGVTRL